MYTAIYIKPVTWAGTMKFYVGYQPSDPKAAPCNKLGSYYICTECLHTATVLAEVEAKRLNIPVVTCNHYVGL